ncbi:DUF2161 domain-containing phosphodiesterase [Anaerotignum sp.]|uniref:DUF2161 domain-containing phosphodiesterase n=1 Tax=Anaerotignum sp. TaxID=2039241 RepID=UPI0027150C4F|nr:DUF2161 family putative PD-(D/E)XK-type phosphodiesterase [Anaerotignum sp.]
MSLKETDLYEPIRLFLEEEGYQVQAEVKNCDIAAVKEGQTLIVELKTRFNLKLVYQALERQSLTDQVYVAIPRPQKGQREKAWKDMLKLLKRLELGLITVALDSPLQTVDVILEPSDSLVRKNRKKQERLQAEMENRQVAENVGGMTRRKIMTAYREKAIELCCIMEQFGQISLKELREMGKEDKYAAMLRSNVYQWFERIEKGVYRLSMAGKEVLFFRDYEKLVQYYRDFYRKEKEK